MKAGADWSADETIFACPSCDGTLFSEPTEAGVALFCPWAQCACREMNDGVEALSLGQACTALSDLFNAWLRAKEEA